MKVIPTALEGVLVLEPRVFGDARGFFSESYNHRAFAQATGLDVNFVQDNHSRSRKGVLRGLHYQIRQPQGKLVRVVRGAVFDVAVDMRQDSPTFGQWAAEILSAENGRQLWLPEGFAHGFYVLDGPATLLYRCTDYYNPSAEQTLRWDDPHVGITWPLQGVPLLSPKDAQGKDWTQAPKLACR